MALVKVAVIRDATVPMGRPAPLRLRCPCGACPEVSREEFLGEVDVQIACLCGRTYSATGWLLSGPEVSA